MKRFDNRFIRAIGFFIFLILCSSDAYGSRADVEAFVTRFYQECLDRDPDSAGLNNWVNSLLNGSEQFVHPVRNGLDGPGGNHL